MIALDVADLVVIAIRMLGLDTGQVLDLLDVAAADRALAQARPGGEAGRPGSEAAGPGTEAAGPGTEAGAAAGRAAALLYALVRERPFRRGSQQVALAATLQFLAVNGWDAGPDPPGPVRDMVARLAAGPVDLQDVTAWLAPRLRPISRPANRAQEAPPMPSRLSPLAEKIKMATMRTQPKGMFTRFTEQARRAVHLAQEEARLLRHGYVSPEHLLLGLLYEGEGVAAKALEALGISWQDARDQVEEITGHGQAPATGHLPFTPQAKKGLELSLREALALGHLSIGTEHLLLGLLRADGSVAVQVLARLGAGQARVQEQV
ncbi:MAG TPA: Clp protease N-terminal domain-containing protein, partial [Streptosporangiaceae bacterium]|nr:Clp protease N-terminal domain-containing protein [Streptosporangiaceae bacterium]